MPGGLRSASLHSGPSHSQKCRIGSKLPSVPYVCGPLPLPLCGGAQAPRHPYSPPTLQNNRHIPLSAKIPLVDKRLITSTLRNSDWTFCTIRIM